MDFTRLIHRKYFYVASACLLAVIYLSFIFLKRSPVSTSEQVEAVGLRGSSRVNKSLSSLQQNKLNEHFLAAPPLAHTSSDRPNSEVAQIIEFNKRQHD